MNEFERIEGVRSDADLERTGGSNDPQVRVEQLTTEIDDTRGDLTQTIAEIGDRLDPANIARDAGETVRQATLGKVEQMTYGAQETWRDVRTGNAGSIVDTITSNPIPAGMVAVGLGLLFMNRGQQSKGRNDRMPFGTGGSWQTRQQDHRSGASPLDKMGSKVSDAGESIGQAADEAGRKVGDVMDSVGQTAEQLPRQAGVFLDRGGNQVRRFIDQNPLGAGAIALAAGAAVGMLLPTTPLERDTLGTARDQLVDKAESAANEALDKVDEQVQQGASPA